MIAQNLEWIKQGLYVDAKDKHGEWQAGLVIAVTKIQIKIRFEGWSSKVDEIYAINTQRIKPFRSITKGYTGQRKYPAVREHWTFNIQNHEYRLAQFEQFVSHISQKSGFEINQYLRGENYFYIDFLLNQTYSNAQQIIKVYAYFKSNLEFVKTYFQQFNQRDTNVWFQAGQKQQLTAKKAYVDLHNEIFESVISIIGSWPRTAIFIKVNQKVLKELYGPQTSSYESFIIKQLYTIQFFNSFDNVVFKISNETKNGFRNVPFTFINSLYSLFVGFEKLSLNGQFKKKINTMFVDIIQQYIESLTVQDAKANQKTIEEILNVTRIISNKLQADKEQICRWVEKAKLKLWIFLIQSDVLEKKLRGINKIKEFYETINRKIINPLQNSIILCTKSQFREWLDQEQLLKIIFETNQHSEVIKKGCEMIQTFYASKHRLCTMGQVIFIWETCFKKHEAIKRIIFQFWNDFAEYVSGQNDWKLFIQVLTKNEENINEDWEIESLFGFLRSIKSDDQNQPICDIILMMYRKTLRNQKYISDFAKELSFFNGSSKVLQQLIDNCLTQISGKREPYFHIKLLARLYVEMHNYKPYFPENIIVVLIEQLKDFSDREENEKLVHTIFNLFNEIMSAKDNGVSLGNPNGVKFTFDNFETLWEIFKNCQIAQFRKFFFIWMAHKAYNSTYNFTQYQINSRFNHEFRLEIFSNIFCDQSKFNYKKIDSYEFAVFKEFFIYSNIKGGTFEYRSYSLGTSHQSHSRRVLRTRSKDVQGLKELWQIFKNCQNEEVVVFASTFLKDIYLRVSNVMPVEEKTERIKSLMEMIQTSINEGQRNGWYALIKRILIIIAKLLTQIKERVDIPKQFERLHKTQKEIITAYIYPGDTQKLQIQPDEPMINVKTMIGKKFHMSRDEFILYNGKQQIPKEFYELPYYLVSSDDNSFRIVKTGNQIGKYVMANVCQHIYHKLIHFLKNEHVCMEAFHLLEYLDVFEPVRLFENLEKEIEQVDQILKNKKKLYLHIFFTRVFVYVLEKEIIEIDGRVLEKMISHLQIPIQSSLIVNYLQKLIEILAIITNKQPEKAKIDDESKVSLNSYRPKLYKLLLNLVKYINRNPHSLSNHQSRLFKNSLNHYMNGFETAKLLFDSFIKDQHFKQFMFQIFIKCEFLQIKEIIEKKFCPWLREGFFSINEEKKVAQFFINQLYYEIYQKDSKKEINGAEFVGIFKIFRTILESVSSETFEEIVYKTASPIENQSFFYHIFHSIQKLSDMANSPNFMLNGQLQIVLGMIKRDRSIINGSFIDFLFYNCLIYVHGKTNGMEVRCLFKENISLVLEIFWYMMVDVRIKGFEENTRIDALSLDQCTEMILGKFREFHYCDDWRSSREWSFEFMELSKTKNDFVGLENPGCICYLNSLLQQLYMIEEFRSAVLNMNSSKYLASSDGDVEIIAGEEDSPELIPKLKLLFLSLMYSERSAIDPQFFTSSIRTAGDRPMVKIFEQMDIDEFSMILFDKIQNKLHHSKTPNFIRELFGGTYSNEIISQECIHSSEREEQFLSISLDVKKHITQGFQSLVKGEMLEGENAYFCDGCDKKVKALKRLSIKRLPPQLIISLRRFEFDYEADQKIKINKYCEFPFELNLEGFSQDKLNESNSTVQRKSQQQRSSTSMNEEELSSQKPQKKNNFPPDYFIYKLKGVVVHTGSADSGHYYSYIEGKDGNWFEFNDEKVSEFDVKNLGEEAFGGKDGEYTRIRNAYLLFYERKAKTHFNNHAFCGSNDNIDQSKSCEKPQNRMSEQANIDSTPTNYFQQSLNQQSLQALHQLMNLQNSLQVPQNREIIEQIVMKNKKIRMMHFFYSKEYLEFVISFLKQALYTIYNIKKDNFLKAIYEYKNIMPVEQGVKLIGDESCLETMNHFEDEIFKFLVSYTFLIQLRQLKFSISLDLLQAIKKIFFQHSNLEKRFYFIAAFLEEIYHQSFIDEFFINCPNKDKSRLVGNFVFEAIKLYIANCPVDQANPFPKIVKNIIKLIMRTVIKNCTNISELLLIIRKIITLQEFHPLVVKQIINFILKKDFVTVMIDNALGFETSMPIRAKRIFNLNNDEENTVLSQNKSDAKLAKRKNSDLSAKDEGDEGNATKKKHYNQKIEIQGEQKSIQDSRFSVLFGQYPEEGGATTKTCERQTWTILYYIQKEIKDKKQQIDKLKENINRLKNIYGHEEEMKMQALPKNGQSAEKAIEIERSFTLISNQKSPQALLQGDFGKNQQISSMSNESTQRMQNSPIEEPEYEGTDEEESEEMSSQSFEQVSPWAPDAQDDWDQLLERDHAKFAKEALEFVNKIYPEVAPLPKKKIDVEINNFSHQVPTESQPHSVGSGSTVTVSVPVRAQKKKENPEMEKSPKIQSQGKPSISQSQKQQNEKRPVSEIQLTPQQQQELIALQNLVAELESEYNQMNVRFSTPLIKIKSDKLVKIISEQKDTKSMIALASFISQLIFNNLHFHEILLSAIDVGLKDYESSKYRPFFVVIEKILEVEDDLAKKRRIEILRIFRNSLRINEKYFVECDLIHQFMLRVKNFLTQYAYKFPAFEAIMRDNPNFINEMKNWISQKGTPGMQTIKKNRQPHCERHPFRNHGIVVSGEIKDYENFSNYKFESFEKIKQNRFVSSIKYPEETKIGEIYKKGDMVEIFLDNGVWKTCLIEENYFGIIQVQMIIAFNKFERNLFSQYDEKVKLKESAKVGERCQKMEAQL